MVFRRWDTAPCSSHGRMEARWRPWRAACRGLSLSGWAHRTGPGLLSRTCSAPRLLRTSEPHTALAAFDISETDRSIAGQNRRGEVLTM